MNQIHKILQNNTKSVFTYSVFAVYIMYLYCKRIHIKSSLNEMLLLATKAFEELIEK